MWEEQPVQGPWGERSLVQRILSISQKARASGEGEDWILSKKYRRPQGW